MELPNEIPIFISATAQQFAVEGEFFEPSIETPEQLAEAVARMVWSEAVALSRK